MFLELPNPFQIFWSGALMVLGPCQSLNRQRFDYGDEEGQHRVMKTVVIGGYLMFSKKFSDDVLNVMVVAVITKFVFVWRDGIVNCVSDDLSVEL